MLIHVYFKDNFVLTILIKHNIDVFNLNFKYTPFLTPLIYKCCRIFIKVKKSLEKC